MDTTQAEAIRERHDRQAELLRDNRMARFEQYREQHSHVGVDLARGMIAATPAVRLGTYEQLATLANALFASGFEASGRVIASLCRGYQRGTIETFGKEAGAELALVELNEPVFEPAPADAPPEPEPEPMTEDAPENEPNDTSLSGVAYAVGTIMASLETVDELDLTTGPQEPDEAEPVDVTKPATSPEPDPDRAERGRKRREARQAAKAAGTLQ